MSRSIWELSLKDMVSSGLVKLDNSMQRTYARMAVYENNLEKQVESTNKSIQMQSNLWGKFTGLVGGYVAIAGITQLGKSIFNLGADMEQVRLSYNTLLYGDKAAADGLIRQLLDFGKATKFTNMEVLEAGQSLLGFGVVQKNVAPIISRLGDLSMGNSAKFGSLVDNYGKMVSAQRGNTMDMNQFAIAGIPIWKELEKLTGKQGQALRKYVEENGVSMQQVDTILEKLTSRGGQFYKMLEQQNKSSGARWGAFMAQMEEYGVRAFTKLQPYINSLIDLGSKVLPIAWNALRQLWQMGKQTADWMREHEGLIWTVAGALGGLALTYSYTNVVMWANSGILKGLTLAEKIHFGWMLLIEWATGKATVAQSLLNATMLNNPIGWVVAGLGAGIAAFTYFYQTSDKFRASIWGLWEATKQVFTNILGLFQRIFSPIGEMLDAWEKRDWGRLSKGVAKHLTGYGLVENVYNYGKEGGFSKGVSEAYGKGKSERIAKEKGEKKKTTSAASDYAASAPGAAPTYNPTTTQTSSSGSSNVGGSGSARNVTVTINQLIGGDIVIHTTNLESSESQIKDFILKALTGTVRDSELALSQ